ncbi:MAG: DUF3299 domain-containing protein [Planctomycetota bacterium]
MSRLIAILAAIAVSLSAAIAQSPKPPAVTPPAGKPTVEVQKPEPAKQDGDKGKVSGKSQEGDKPQDGGKSQDGGKQPDKPKSETPIKEPSVEVEEDPEDLPLPPGASPEDIRAMRSQAEMLRTERRLMERLREGKIKGIEKLVRFEDICDWPYDDGLKGCPEAVRKLDGKKVAMIGFMLPIDEVENIKEFLLVQSLWACCYGTPPDINGIVRVVMKGDKRTDYQFEPVLVTGTFRVRETREDEYCIDVFQLEAEDVSVVK